MVGPFPACGVTQKQVRIAKFDSFSLSSGGADSGCVCWFASVIDKLGLVPQLYPIALNNSPSGSKSLFHLILNVPSKYKEASWYNWYGKNVEGIITEIHSWGVEMDILSLPVSTRGHLHISQASEGQVENLATLFAVGQILRVKVRLLRKDKTGWEVSLKAVLVEARWAAEFPDSSGAIGCVERVGEFGALVRLKCGLVGRVSAYNLSLIPQSHQLEVGATIVVKMGKWDFESRCPLLHPVITVAVAGLIDAVNVSLHIASEKKKNIGSSKTTVRVSTESYGVVDCDISRLIKIQERFRVGRNVMVSIELASWIRRVRQGEVILDESDKIKYGQVPEVGSVIEVLVIRVVDYGAFCKVADNLAGLIHHKSVIHDKTPELGRYIRPGDLISVRVLSTPPDRPGLSLDFVTMVTPASQVEQQADSHRNLFNLAQEKRKRVSGGFKRTGSFRTDVRDAFDDTCILCGMSQRISDDISLAEAAHIVPHSRRGADIIENAICLCPVCHWAFDRGLIGITRENIVVVSGMISNDSDVSTSLRKLDGRQVVFPASHKIPYSALEWHMRNIFWDLTLPQAKPTGSRNMSS